MKIYYDSTRFPDLTEYGLYPVNVIYFQDLNDLRGRARTARTLNQPVVLELEGISFSGDYVTGISDVIRTMKAEEPNLSLGVFGNAPYSSWSYSLMTNKPDAFEYWRKKNDRMAEIALISDCLYPGVYAQVTDIECWKGSFHSIKKEAERYKKPIRFFVCPTLETQGTDFLPAAMWKTMLDTIQYYNAEMVLWQHGFQYANFSEDAEWFAELLRHLS